MRIVLDAMGGDHAPGEIVRGGVWAARALGVDVVLVGRPEAVHPLLAAQAAHAHHPAALRRGQRGYGL